ncbi:hypothetical protein Esti_005809 [Eimeria stiedai]
MIICIGPICVPIWHLGVIALVILRPLIDLFRRFCGSRAEGTEEEKRTAPATAAAAGNAASGMHTGASQGGATPHKRRGKGVISVQSQEEFDNLRAAAEAAGQPLFVDFGATWCGPCRRIAAVYELQLAEYSPNSCEPRQLAVSCRSCRYEEVASCILFSAARLQRLAHSYSGTFASVDVDECYDLPDLPPALPTFRVYRPRQGVVDSLSGANEEKLRAMIAKHAAPISSS